MITYHRKQKVNRQQNRRGVCYVTKKNKLRGAIITVFGSVRAFAKVIGWSNRKAYAIVCGRQEPTARDIEQMCDLLNIEIPAEMKALFF